MMLKGISTIIAEILMVVIVLALAGSTWFLVKMLTKEEPFEKQQGSLLVLNDKEEPITFLSASVDGQDVSVYIQNDVIAEKGMGNITLLGVPEGKKTNLRLCDKDICNNYKWDVSAECGIYLDGNNWMPEKYSGKFDLKKIECIK